MSNNARTGFARVELLTIVILSLIITALLLAAGDRSRRLARLGDDEAHLRELATANHAYAAQFADRFATFSWRTGAAPIPPGDPNGAGLFTAATDLQAAANQMVYLMRTVAGRPETPVISAFIPHIGYSHFALAAAGYLKLPTRTVVSSENPHRIRWANDPLGYDQGLYVPNLGTGGVNIRQPYAADFRAPAAWWDASPVNSRVASGGTTSTFTSLSSTVLAPQLLSSVAFPSSKVMLTDYVARHFGPRLPFCTSNESRLPQLMADGAIVVKSAAAANPGCNPNTGQPISMSYSPSAIDPPATGANAQIMSGRFLWTRRALAGRDYNGPEVPGF
jgi:hypothetical protein